MTAARSDKIIRKCEDVTKILRYNTSIYNEDPPPSPRPKKITPRIEPSPSVYDVVMVTTAPRS